MPHETIVKSMHLTSRISVIHWLMQFFTNWKQVIKVLGDGGLIFLSEVADVES